ncbi:hypothetical protein [Ktedonosporobacter rubrisoli]|uniref:hypothetical protein n=1 Tax=Ktedonosporobacter rubrisoli TaxID=2509675 RepID=UPI003BF49797
MLSPGPDIPVSDMRQWTRDLMRALEQRCGLHLHWYAVQHHNTEHSHVHVIISGCGEDQTGQLEPVFLCPDDYAFLKERGKELSDLAYHQLIKDTLRVINQQDSILEKGSRDEH